MKKRIFCIISLSILSFAVLVAKNTKTTENTTTIDTSLFNGFKFRSIGPAWASGRIAEFAVNPENIHEYYVGVASGNIWKTINSGITWEPVFDKYGSYAIGCVVMDPKNHHVVWAGTGENNSQRALGHGDGVYKTIDGDKSWKNMGLKESRQIGKIIIHPENTDIVYVAAEGSLWGPGGERGVYKTTDGGKTWNAVLTISENTGVSDMAMDPRDPDILYAVAHQRRRHVFTKINGGPESGIHKTTDGGKTWRKIHTGLPKVHLGGCGIAISSVNPDVLYLIVEAADNKGGFFRSTNRGETWEKMSSYASSGQYYNEIYCDPVDVDKVYSMDTWTMVTEDGGKTWRKLGNNKRHVDDHALWINPENTAHLLIGGDGGIYESFDNGKNWDFKENLPITQFYRVNVDNSKPFYYVYGGTQDNNTSGGPSRNTCKDGVTNDEWFITLGGDGFWSAIDPENPDIVYSEYQYGNVYRYDRKSGERIGIKPQERKGELTYKWNWDAPLIISPHKNTRLYIAANKVFKSEDRGNSWEVISDDLTTGIDRNTWKVMGKYWSTDAVAKDVSTSQYGTIVAMTESPIKEGLLFIGTDDGLIQVKDGDADWKKITNLPGVPEYTYVSDILTSRYDENVVYATFKNHKRDDFKPYILKSTDKGNTWKSISSNLPVNGVVHTIVEDHLNKDLLFCGTEFGIFVSIDGGESWNRLKSGIPTISVKDLVIQERENDLVAATFGRGFYILDDYSALRDIENTIKDKDAHIFPVKDALMYIETRAKRNQGSTYYTAKNPPFGATFNYYLKDEIKTQTQKRKKIEKGQFKKGEKIKVLSWDELREEAKEENPYLLFVIYDEEGDVVRKIPAKAQKGINQVTWDLRYYSKNPFKLKENKYDPFMKIDRMNTGILAMPGNYEVELYKSVDGELTKLTDKVAFKAKVLNNTTLPADDREELVNFQKKVSIITKSILGSIKQVDELLNKVNYLKQANLYSEILDAEINKDLKTAEDNLKDIKFLLEGHEAKASREEIPPGNPALTLRLFSLTYTHWASTSAPTETQKMSYDIIKEELVDVINKLNEVKAQLNSIEEKLKVDSSPWIPEI